MDKVKKNKWCLICGRTKPKCGFYLKFWLCNDCDKKRKKWKNDIEIMEAWGFNEKGEQVCVTSDDIRTLISKEKQKSFEQGWQMGHKQTKEDYQYSKQHKSALLKFKEDILTDLYIIRASIPPSFGMGARKLTKKLIDKLEDEK